MSSKLAIAAAALLTSFSTARADSWERELTAVLWASGLDGRQSVDPVSADFDASFSDLVEFLDVGSAMRFTVQRERIG